MAPEPRRITLVTDELLGYTRTGGLGTATSFLAIALGRKGHQVELLYVADPPTTTLGEEWARLYEAAGVTIRLLPRSDTPVEPSYFARMRDVERALAADPPDVVITQDLAAPAYTAIRTRQLGLGFDNTLFVVYCHGTRRWITDVARKVSVLPGALGVTVLEQASIELADVVVSPSEYLVEWMKQQGWRLPLATHVIPHLTRASATGEPEPEAKPSVEPIRQIAFFGRLEERKGIRPFIAAVNALPDELVEDLEVEFIGRSTPAWTPDRVRALLSNGVRASFETDLDQPEALARLARPGTLAVIPSYEETFAYTVRECLDYGIPFIASNAAAICELIDADDRARVLFEPTPKGLEDALRRTLSSKGPMKLVRAAFDTADSLRAWAEITARRAEPRASVATKAQVDVVVVRRGSPRALARCLAALERQSYREFRVLVGEGPTVQEARQDALEAGSAPFALFLDEEDEPEPELLATLVRAQSVSGADVVSCALRLRDEGETVRFFIGDPGGLGLLSNSYGTVALLRRSLLQEVSSRRQPEGEPDWQLLAGLSLGGALIVSVPAPLLTSSVRPASLEREPADALLVVEAFERELPQTLRAISRIAGGLAAASARTAPNRGRVRLRPLRRVIRASS